MDVVSGLSRTTQNRWGVAQLAERLAVNQEVGGSSPPAPVAIKKSPSIHACSLPDCPVGCACYWQDPGSTGKIPGGSALILEMRLIDLD